MFLMFKFWPEPDTNETLPFLAGHLKLIKEGVVNNKKSIWLLLATCQVRRKNDTDKAESFVGLAKRKYNIEASEMWPKTRNALRRVK